MPGLLFELVSLPLRLVGFRSFLCHAGSLPQAEVPRYPNRFHMRSQNQSYLSASRQLVPN
jgi:hypothetical protein